MKKTAAPAPGGEVSEPSPPRRRGRPMTGRRDDILRAAARLFYERGYGTTSMDDVGEAVGVTGPAVYRHFRSKDGLLLAAIESAADRSEAQIREIHEAGGSPIEMLRRLIESQVREGIEQTHLIGLAMREANSLPREVLTHNQRRNRINREEWVHLLSQVRTDLSDAEARAMVLAMKQLVYAVITADVGLTNDQRRHLATSLVYSLVRADLSREADDAFPIT